jgi:hypothetical protein
MRKNDGKLMYNKELWKYEQCTRRDGTIFKLKSGQVGILKCDHKTEIPMLLFFEICTPYGIRQSIRIPL